MKLARASKPEVLEIDRVNFEFNLIGKIIDYRACYALSVRYSCDLLTNASIVDTAMGLYSAENRKICALLGIIHLLSGM